MVMLSSRVPQRKVTTSGMHRASNLRDWEQVSRTHWARRRKRRKAAERKLRARTQQIKFFRKAESLSNTQIQVRFFS